MKWPRRALIEILSVKAGREREREREGEQARESERREGGASERQQASNALNLVSAGLEGALELQG